MPSLHQNRAPEVSRPRRISEIDSLLQTPRKPEAAPETALGPEASLERMQTPGIFLGLRVALLFNAALGVFGFACYEAWIALTH